MQPISLENQTLGMKFDPKSGCLTHLTATQTGWEILKRPELGLSYRLLVPLRGDKDWHTPMPRHNSVLGKVQNPPKIVTLNNQQVIFQWDEVLSEAGGVLSIRIRAQVVLKEDRVIFSIHLDNRSDYIIENVYYPYLGDIAPPHGAEWFRTFTTGYSSPTEYALWPTFQNLRGYYGVDYPTQVGSSVPAAPFILLRSEQQGLYLGVDAPSSELVAWHTELHPGYQSAIDQRVPRDAATRFAAVHLPYIQPGEGRELTPIALQAYEGDWQAGTDIYKNWRSGWMKFPRIPKWVREPHSWQQLHINSPEDELRLPFSALTEVGEECARNGVKAIQLVGWSEGGQDQGNPSHDPDPRLGTYIDLKQAIAQIQATGVRVVLFAKFTWADQATDTFRQDLHSMAVKNPYGDYYVYNGYQYQTATQLLDINTKRLIPMCFLNEEYLALCENEFQKILELGADGILYDECQHHTPALLCFDESHGHRRGAPVYANDRLLIQRLRRLAAEYNSEFLFAGEACYDWEMEVYHLAYFRTESKTHLPLARYLLPESQYLTAVTGFNDRHMINQCLLYRYIISYEPYNFKGHLDDFPSTVAYGRKMDALRTELREYFWDGEFCHEVGANVYENDQPHHPYSVFRNATDGKLSLVVANYEEIRPITVEFELSNGGTLTRYKLVDDSEWKCTSDGVILPPMSAAVILP